MAARAGSARIGKIDSPLAYMFSTKAPSSRQLNNMRVVLPTFFCRVTPCLLAFSQRTPSLQLTRLVA